MTGGIMRIMPKENILYIEVREIVNKYDPIHLIAIGCPKDEYDPEVRRITRRLRNISDVGDLLNIVHRTFIRMFTESLAGPKESYQQLANDLFELKASL